MARGATKLAALPPEPVEGPWELPAGWRWERLGDVVRRSSAKVAPTAGSALPFVGLDSIPPHEMRITGTVPFGTLRSAGAAFQRGQVLYGRLRPYLNKVWVAEFDGACSGELLVLDPIPEILPEYLALNLHHHRFVHFASHAVAGDRPRIDFSEIARFEIPVPPVDVQQAIVGRVGELFADIAEGVAALTAAAEGQIAFHRSLLQAAVTGYLTGDWRAANPGLPLLSDVRDLTGLPELPAGWAWRRAEGLSEFITKGTTPPKGDLGPEPLRVVPFIRVTNLTDTGALDFSDPRFVSESTHRGFLARSRVLPGDVLMNIVGPPLGQVSIVPSTYDEWNINQAIARFRVRDLVSAEFFALYLRSHVARTWLASRAKATSGQINLTLELCRDLPVPVPPRPEQDLIVAECAASDDLPLDPTLEAAPAQLRQAILAAAFLGQLAQ